MPNTRKRSSPWEWSGSGNRIASGSRNTVAAFLERNAVTPNIRLGLDFVPLELVAREHRHVASLRRQMAAGSGLLAADEQVGSRGLRRTGLRQGRAVSSRSRGFTGKLTRPDWVAPDHTTGRRQATASGWTRGFEVGSIACRRSVPDERRGVSDGREPDADPQVVRHARLLRCSSWSSLGLRCPRSARGGLSTSALACWRSFSRRRTRTTELRGCARPPLRPAPVSTAQRLVLRQRRAPSPSRVYPACAVELPSSSTHLRGELFPTGIMPAQLSRSVRFQTLALNAPASNLSQTAT